MEKLQMISIYPLDNGTDWPSSNRDMMTTAVVTIAGSSCWETTLLLILGSTVNDNRSEGLSCQSEVIGLLIIPSLSPFCATYVSVIGIG